MMFLRRRELYRGGVKRLPKGYTEVEYIRNTSDARIDVNRSFMKGFRIVTDFMVDDLKEEYYNLVGAWQPKYHNLLRLASKFYPSYLYMCCGDTWLDFHSSVLIDTKKWYSVDASNVNGKGRMVLSVDDRTYEYSHTFTDVRLCWYSFWLFALHRIDVPLYQPFYGAMKEVKLYDETDALVRDFVPCISPEKVTGMYDLVEGRFYSSMTNVPFEAGPVVK